MPFPLIGAALPAISSFLGTAGGGALAGAALPYLPDIARGAYNNILKPAGEFIESNVLNPAHNYLYPNQNVSGTTLQRWLSPQEKYQQQFEASPERQAQKGLLSQLQQPQNVSFDPIRQRALEQYEERIKPGIMQRYANMNLFGSGPHQQELRRGEADLAKSLAALEAEWQRGGQGLDLNRLNQLSGFLSGQQQLGLANQQAQAQQQQFGHNLALQQLGAGSKQGGQDVEAALKTILANLERQKTGTTSDLERSRQYLTQTFQPIISQGTTGAFSPGVRALVSGYQRRG